MKEEIKGIKLSQWAEENNIAYKKAWQMYSDGDLPVKTRTTDTGRVICLTESKASIQPVRNQNITFGTPVAIEGKKQEIKAARANRSALGTPLPQYPQISQGVNPIQMDAKGSNINISEAIRLTRLAYWNFPIFGNTIDAMTEFSTNKIYYRGGNAKSRKFFQDLDSATGMLAFQDKFFREYYRSSNVFIHRFESVPTSDDLGKINKTYGIQAKDDVKIPSKYIILNPTDIGVQGNVMFGGSGTIYYKRLNGYELNRLRKPESEEEQNFLNSLPPEVQKAIKDGFGSVNVPLNPEDIYAIFYRRQDYEPLAVPMGFAVLKDIEFKAEMKQIDMAVARTMNNVILLIKMGYESKNGEYVFDDRAAAAMQELFQSESVGKTLVADFTTEAEFKIPQIGDFLDPKKYQIVNEDIKTGLNYILSGGDGAKFSNQYIQVQLFIQRLTRAREAFLNEFLIPEIKRISKLMGFRAYPTPVFEDIDLKDDAEFNRIVAQLVQYGILTAEESLTAIETGRLPTGEESLESQQKFKEAKDKGFYEPIIGGPATQKDLQDSTNKQQLKVMDKTQEHDSKMKTRELKHKADNPEPVAPQIHFNAPNVKMQSGRPTGGGTKKSTNKPRTMKASEELHSLSKIKDNLILATELTEKVKSILLKRHNLTELHESQLAIVDEIVGVIMGNETADNWISKAGEYVENPINKNEDRLREIDELAYNHQISPFLASILFESGKE